MENRKGSMGRYFESGIGKASGGSSVEIGRQAATQALSQLIQFDPSLALVFTSSEYDIPGVTRGVREILGDCPTIGTSTAGEIANGFISHGVVVALIASPHLRVRVGMGRDVSRDFKKATDQALGDASVSEYFNPEDPRHQMLHMSAAGAPGVSPVLLIVFSPGSTRSRLSLSHDIHTVLRKASANRIPIFGGSSGDYFKYESNYQIVNDNVSDDAVALAFLESEILFGLGLAHGYNPTTKRAIVTRASGHIVHELDGRPAAEIYAEFMDMSVDKLIEHHTVGPAPLNGCPFASIDVYGNSILHVPERIFEDGSIVFTQLMRNDQVITLMQGTKEDIVRSGITAYEKALRHGGLSRPSLVLMASCALRLQGENEQEEVAFVQNRAKIPVCGFYTYGEKGIFDDGFPVHSTQSVSMLVFSDELNPVASLIHRGKAVYQEYTSQLKRKVSQIKSLSRINQIIQEGTDVNRLLASLTTELLTLFPWAHGAFYMEISGSHNYSLVNATDFEQFPAMIGIDDKLSSCTFIEMESQSKHLGCLVLKQKDSTSKPEDEDIALAETIGSLAASGINRIDIDGKLDVKLQQLEILNQLGHELSKSISTSSQSQNIVRHIRRILRLSFTSLWLVDKTHHLLVRESMDGDPELEIDRVKKENDERLARWQVEHQQTVFYTMGTGEEHPIDLMAPFPFSYVSLPVIYKGQTRGILNLFSEKKYKWSLNHQLIFGNIEFLQSVSTQVAIFFENRSLHQNATFYREMHHRVKNNLQNIASLLRMQLRRLNRISPEQALSDSIARIMSIAMVHETLSQGEIGMVDVGRLVGSISKLPDSDALGKIMITLDISGPPVLIPSREATSLALVINELVQNAVQHGFGKSDKGRLFIRVGRINGEVSVIVRDNGPGFPEGFDFEKDGNLGLTIVRTLVKEELKGRFELDCSKNTQAKVKFPFPQRYYKID